MCEDIAIPTYVVNLKERTDRLQHILKQFKGKPEFEVHIIEACSHEIGAVGLWQSILKIIEQVKDGDDDVIIICEDDHMFTEHYDRERFMQNVIDASEQKVELLFGGIGGFGNAVPVSKNRFWIDWLWCTQFMVLYRPVFKKILDYNFTDKDTADGVFSELTSHKMVLYPFISVQSDFGYSDVTRSNNEISGMITTHFVDADKKMKVYYDAYTKYFLSD
jgi:GR25 family glycosyltransferase involved in LPS biosynthesis